MSKYKVLIADDEVQMLMLVSSYLEKEGYETVTAEDGAEVLSRWSQGSYDLVILDIMMPTLDGFAVCRKIREVSNVPIIMLTAKSEELDRIRGLKLGADDYIVKPFSPKELMARVEALLRRSNNFRPQKHVLELGDLIIDLDGHTAEVKGKRLNLTRKEFSLLEFFFNHQGQVFSREQLLEHVWGLESTGTLRTVDTHIKTLRIKLGSSGDLIKTVWGVGYKFEE
ncbi:response regulator transcription factor [Neobacillus sp. YIM B02564]|jgi:two-component system response regulator ResD|uniref:Response regulator transcription factor n=1 Tax=Neobacillus paridis TaxID=2803862 RepID=A0ABS1TKJ4_9BACI|nr:response regulator transcription factor [Neobacillus paridis]MBL4951529.1 response regulator transcription factor [Neobacillus paridis]